MAPSYRRTKQSKGHVRRSQVVYHRPRKIKTIIYLLLCVIVVIGGLYGGYTILSNINSGGIDVNVVKNQELSIHFLELGNKSTGDCTFIKAGNTDILIDAGSTAGSIPTIENYLNQYVEDNKLEYVIVTHAHEDHYAGFATSENKESLFDIYDVGTVIHFAQVEAGKAETVMYLNFQRELNELKTRCGAEVYTAKECVDNVNGAKKIYDIGKNIQLEILDQIYYHKQTTNENNHSVCCQIIQNSEKYYLFTGDLELEGEESLVELNNLCQVELFKAGHHGSYTSSNKVLLDVIQPNNVCVCCCAGSNEYKAEPENKFPSQSFIDRIAPHTDRVFVTTLYVEEGDTFCSMNGNIVVCCNLNDTVVNIYCSNNTTLLKDTDWFAKNRKIPVDWL